MTSLQLDKLLSGHVFAFLLIFSRIGPVMLLLPGIGETYVSRSLRAMFGMTISFLLMEPLLPRIPEIPGDIAGLVRLIGFEIIIGLFFGSMTRVFMSALETVGAIVAIQTGLSNAVILNPALATQSPLASAFYSAVGVTLVFATGLDHFLLRSVVATYDLFPPGGGVAAGDMAQSYAQAFAASFRVGIELSSPFLVVGLLMYVALGVMQRLMPQVQLFLVALPVQIWGGMFLIAITIGSVMGLWLNYFDQSVSTMFTGMNFVQ